MVGTVTQVELKTLEELRTHLETGVHPVKVVAGIRTAILQKIETIPGQTVLVISFPPGQIRLNWARHGQRFTYLTDIDDK